MFTGIIESLGTIEETGRVPGGTRVRIGCAELSGSLAVGDSIAIDGVCLTVTASTSRWFEAEISPETGRRSTLGRLRAGRVVNLERPLAAGGRLGGHFVQGHVDGTCAVRSLARQGDFVEMTLETPRNLRRYVVEKGSISVNGVSLTVASLRGGVFTVALIPHTLKMTNLSRLRAGSRVNLEVDILAKYVESLVAARRGRG